MRDISPASLAKLTQKMGTEPTLIVEVEWEVGQAPAVYGDKRVDGVDPRIIQVANLDDVINISKSGTSQSVTLTLDDVDGSLKSIFNSVDIHKKVVRIYQWFTGIPLTEKFLLFYGLIMSPVIWKEGDRTLTFTVTSQIDDVEVGFSPEEGEFNLLPAIMEGTVWPLVFGTVLKLQTFRIDDIPYVSEGDNEPLSPPVTTEGTGIVDPALAPAIKDNENTAGYAAALAQAMFVGYLQASFTARKRGELGDLDSIDVGKGQFSGLAKQFLQQGNSYLLQAQQVRTKNDNLKIVHQAQKDNQRDKIGISNGKHLPQNRLVDVNLGGAKHTGTFIGNYFHIASREHPDQELFTSLTLPAAADANSPTFTRGKYFWADAGTPITIGLLPSTVTDGDVIAPVRYLIAATISVSVLGVYAYRTVDELRNLTPVPSEYYEVIGLEYGDLKASLLYFKQPLSSRVDESGKREGWDDQDVYVDVKSTVGPNTVDVIRWLIETYTTHAIDEPSFATVRAIVDNYPCGFAVLDRPQVIQLVGQVARQSRCIVWLKNDKFFIKYLPKKAAPVATITEADIIEQSLEVTYTESEDLKTKIVAEWNQDYISKPYLVVLRYNIAQYGMHERRDKYFIYNMQQLVEKSATFWLVREANTFKRLSLKVPLTFLNIETLDTVTLNFSHDYIAYGPIDGIVESASLDTNDYTIQLTIWVPVRAGEMVEYDFCWPGDLTVEYVFPTAADVKQGRVTKNNVTEAKPFPPQKPNPFMSAPFSRRTVGGQLHIAHHRHTWGVIPPYFVDETPENSIVPEISTKVDTTGDEKPPETKPPKNPVPLGRKPEGTTKYQIDRAKVKASPVDFKIVSGSYPAQVKSGSGDSYTCMVYINGLPFDPIKVDNVKQLQIDDDEVIPADTWVIAHEIIKKESDITYVSNWYMQIPVWL